MKIVCKFICVVVIVVVVVISIIFLSFTNHDIHIYNLSSGKKNQIIDQNVMNSFFFLNPES